MKNTLITTAVILSICFALPVASLAQDGSLDLTFDTDGMVITPNNYSDKARSVAIQNDGKIVILGDKYDGSTNHFALVRYNTNGSLDNTFDTDGMDTTSFGNGSDFPISLAIENDGKIVVVGYRYSINDSRKDFALARYNTNGSLDTTFDTDGMVTTSIGNWDSEAQSLAIQSDGKIVVAGYYASFNGYNFALVRYNTNGSLDNTFNTDGIDTTAIGINFNYAYSVAIQNDGKIIVAGSSYIGNYFNISLVRYNTNGSLDNTFDTDGIVTTDLGDDSGALSVAIQSDDKIVIAGFIPQVGETDDILLVRYNTNGSLDTTFDTDGVVTTSVGTSVDARANSLAIQSDGKIVVAGFGDEDGEYIDFTLVRYNTNGSLDNTFDTDGIVTTVIGTSYSEANSLAIQSDGKIVVAGYSNNGNHTYYTVVRYNNTITSGLNTIPNQNAEIYIYPNPFSTQTILHTEKFFENATLIIYDTYGQKVKEIKNINGQTFTILRDHLPSGLYFIHLTENNTTLSVNKFVITD